MRLALLSCLALALPLAAGAEAGTVDWQRKVVKCTGTGAPNLRAAAGNVAVARIGAERAAKLDALRNCMEALKGVTVKSGETVGGALSGTPGLQASVEGVVKGFRVVGSPRYFSDGGVEMDVEVPIEGKLSDLIMPKGAGEEKAPPPTAESHATGLILDARGIKIAPALAPRILDEAGKEVYGPGLLTPEARKWNGAAYARDPETARKELSARVGDRPVVVKARRAEGADAVVQASDADELRRGQKFLAEGRVVIVTD